MKNYIQPLTMITLTALLATGSVYAAGDHDKPHHESGMQSEDHDHNSGMKHDNHNTHEGHDNSGSAMGKMFLVNKQINGYDVTFHVMQAKEGKEMGGTHDFMIKVEKDGKVLTDITMNTKVIHPDGKAETKKTMKMGDWLMAGYDLGHAGKHQLMILFKTADGEKHKGGVYYP